jgi:hypothetical protein
MNARTIIFGIFGVVVVLVAFVGASLLLNVFWPNAPEEGRPQLVAVPPLKPLSGTSTVLTPTAIGMSAIRDALEAQAPRNFAGKPQNPIPQLLINSDFNFAIARGQLNVSARSDALVISTQFSGGFQARGSVAGSANTLGAIGNMIGGSVGQQVYALAGKAFEQHADIHGTVTATSHPAITPNWRLLPNLTAQVSVADVSIPVAGAKLSVANEVKPVIDDLVRDQTGALETRLRNDPFIENAARGQWAKLCRAIHRRAAEDRRQCGDAVSRRAGGNSHRGERDQAELSLSAATRYRAPGERGTLDIAVPIDIPFTEVSRLIDVQVKGKTYPEDGSGAFATTIRQATVAASGDRLLISLLVNVKKRGCFSLGADATVHVWGKPVLDQGQQILRFTDVAVDVQSRAAFGLLGEAAQAAVPYLQRTLAEHAAVDLKPFAADAKKRMAAAVGDFTGQASGVTANVVIDDVRLLGIAYDDNTLRVITDAKGTVNVAISSLALQ